MKVNNNKILRQLSEIPNDASFEKELKRLIWEEWESEIKEEDPRQMVFKYMLLMRDRFKNVDEKYRIGKIVKPKKLDWLTEEKLAEYVNDSLLFRETKDVVIEGHIFHSYLSKHDYDKIYLKDPVGSINSIIKQIKDQLNGSK